jgi:hypothetical protein
LKTNIIVKTVQQNSKVKFYDSFVIEYLRCKDNFKDPQCVFTKIHKYKDSVFFSNGMEFEGNLKIVVGLMFYNVTIILTPKIP